jgi:Fe-S oxidoreductase
MNSGAGKYLLSRALGVAKERPLPMFASERFDRWFQRRRPTAQARRGRVLLWDDTFVRYYEPDIGKAAVAVLEAAGFEVALVKNRQCCGRPAFSQGHLGRAAQLGRHNLGLLSGKGSEPILFLEPSCYSMFVEEYLELRLDGAAQVAERCFLFEDFIDRLLERDPSALPFAATPSQVAIHVHCHAKALGHSATAARLARRLPATQVAMLNTGCCGMAGAFGTLESKQELSRRIAEPLVKQVQAQPAGTLIVASGTSCRQQTEHLAGVRPLHMAELLARHLR